MVLQVVHSEASHVCVCGGDVNDAAELGERKRLAREESLANTYALFNQLVPGKSNFGWCT
jgi:hypothetical protein